jgi:hypothetical protein
MERAYWESVVAYYNMYVLWNLTDELWKCMLERERQPASEPKVVTEPSGAANEAFPGYFKITVIEFALNGVRKSVIKLSIRITGLRPQTSRIRSRNAGCYTAATCWKLMKRSRSV